MKKKASVVEFADFLLNIMSGRQLLASVSVSAIQ